MAGVMVCGSTLRRFLQDELAFNSAIDLRFHQLDLDSDGVLSPSELRAALLPMRLGNVPEDEPLHDDPAALHDSAFHLFDAGCKGVIDVADFRSQMRAIATAIADSLGGSYVQMLIEEGSILADAVKHEQMTEAQNWLDDQCSAS